MLPLATGSRKRIGSCVSCCVRALLSISRYICDLWERHFVLGQHNEQHPWKTLQEPAWRQKRMCCCGGWAGWSWNAFLEDIAKLSLFYSRLPAMTKGWGIIMEWKKKQTMQKLSLKKKNACVKSEVKIPHYAHYWIIYLNFNCCGWIESFGSAMCTGSCSLNALKTALKKWSWYIANPPLLQSCSAQEISCCIPFWHMAFHRGGWKTTKKWKTVLFEPTSCKNDLTKWGSFWSHKVRIKSNLKRSYVVVCS